MDMREAAAILRNVYKEWEALRRLQEAVEAVVGLDDVARSAEERRRAIETELAERERLHQERMQKMEVGEAEAQRASDQRLLDSQRRHDAEHAALTASLTQLRTEAEILAKRMESSRIAEDRALLQACAEAEKVKRGLIQEHGDLVARLQAERESLESRIAALRTDLAALRERLTVP
jgi:hypothetical protein